MHLPVPNCSSCGACANVCARDAISMQLDGEGFYRPIIDAAKCVNCGACEKVCPWNNAVDNPNCADAFPKTVAAYAKDETIRMESSSGGIFTLLARKVLDGGGVVAGVAQLSPTKFGHVIVCDKTELAKLRGTKYVQANVGLVYREIRALLKSGRKVLFSGTPCQVAALYAVLGKNAISTGLTTVDVVCHGVPSVKVFEKYVDELEKKQNSKIESIVFRNKNMGWKEYLLAHKYENQIIEFVRHLKSPFMKLFLNDVCGNVSCPDCHYRKLPRIADITLGDFWGVSQHHPEMDDDKGTSVVLLNTKHGGELFDSIADEIIQCDSKIEYAITGNPCIVRSDKSHPKRAEFFTNLNKYPLDQLREMYCPFPSRIKRLYSRVRRILSKQK